MYIYITYYKCSDICIFVFFSVIYSKIKMSSSVLDPLCCGFVKVGMFEIRCENRSSKNKNTSVAEVSVSLESQYKQFRSEFEFVDITYEWYRRNVNRVRDSLQSLGKNSNETKSIILDCFSRKKWSKVINKERHSLFDCKECLRSDKLCPTLSLFPINKKDFRAKKRADESGLFRPPIEDKVMSSLEQLKKEFRSQYDKSFEEAAFEVSKKLKRKEERFRTKESQSEHREPVARNFSFKVPNNT